MGLAKPDRSAQVFTFTPVSARTLGASSALSLVDQPQQMQA